MALAAVLLASFGGVPKAQPVAGAVVILGIAYALSTNRRAIDLKTVLWGLGLQIVFALFVLKNEWGQRVFQTLGDLITRLLDFAERRRVVRVRAAGRQAGLAAHHDAVLGAEGARYSMIFAFQVLPTIIFIAALFAILYYYGVMQVVVRLFAWGMRKVMKASGAETLNVAASIFMGQTEAPLTIRPYLPKMTQSELMTVMTSGMAHISGGIMAAYILFGIDAQAPADGGHHDGARHADDGEDVRARDRAARDDGHGEARGRADRRQRDRRGRARHGRRACTWR